MHQSRLDAAAPERELPVSRAGEMSLFNDLVTHVLVHLPLWHRFVILFPQLLLFAPLITTVFIPFLFYWSVFKLPFLANSFAFQTVLQFFI
jgi:predicted membrane metal-binding protein